MLFNFFKIQILSHWQVFMILIVTSKIYAFVQKKRGRDVYLPGQQTPSWTDSDSEQKHGSEIEFIESTAKMIKK